MIVLAVFVGFMNVQTRSVRAETFGQSSMLYQMVSADGGTIVEVVKAGDLPSGFGQQSSYLKDTVVDARAHVDIQNLGEPYATSQAGPSAVATSLAGTSGRSGTTSQTTTPKRNEVETYEVQEGDTIGGIATQFGLSLSTILWANDLDFDSTIRPGDQLTILPKDGIRYSVKSGDTLLSIASTYNVDTDAILKENALASADRLSIGDELMLPGAERRATSAPKQRTAPVKQLFTPEPSRVANKPAPAGGGWVWPTDWRVITQYYGWRHTGIDVDGDYSTNSYASRGGVVIYSGWRTGYGLTVELDHGNGYVTRYAHHSKIYVSVGDVVSTGQALAQTGTTGRSTGTHLHFEIIRNGKFTNPLDYVR